MNRLSGWQAPGPATGYETPLSIRYDPRNPSRAMAVTDYADYRDFAYWKYDLALLAAGLALAGPAAVRFLRT